MAINYPVLYQYGNYTLQINDAYASAQDYQEIIGPFLTSKFFLSGDIILPYNKGGYQFQLIDSAGGSKALGVYVDGVFLQQITTASGSVQFSLNIDQGQHVLTFWYNNAVIIRMGITVTRYALFLWTLASVWLEYRQGITEIQNSIVVKNSPSITRLQQIFGYVIGVSPDSTWDVETYREIIQEVMWITQYAGEYVAVQNSMGIITAVEGWIDELRFEDTDRQILHDNLIPDTWRTI